MNQSQNTGVCTQLATEMAATTGPAAFSSCISTLNSIIWIIFFRIRCDLALLKNFIEVYLISNVVLISAIAQGDSVIHTCIILQIIFHYGLSQDVN